MLTLNFLFCLNCLCGICPDFFLLFKNENQELLLVYSIVMTKHISFKWLWHFVRLCLWGLVFFLAILMLWTHFIVAFLSEGNMGIDSYTDGRALRDWV